MQYPGPNLNKKTLNLFKFLRINETVKNYEINHEPGEPIS